MKKSHIVIGAVVAAFAIDVKIALHNRKVIADLKKANHIYCEAAHIFAKALDRNDVSLDEFDVIVLNSITQ